MRSDSLREFIRVIEDHVTEDGFDLDRALEPLRRSLEKADLLDGLSYTFASHEYTRHLLHADAEGRFSVLALIWPPGQSTPLHGHHTWCAAAVKSGHLLETIYRVEEKFEALHCTEVGSRLLAPTQVSFNSAGSSLAHRVSNVSDGLAISVHVYGVPASAIEDGINAVLAPPLSVHVRN